MYSSEPGSGEVRAGGNGGGDRNDLSGNAVGCGNKGERERSGGVPGENMLCELYEGVPWKLEGLDQLLCL